MSTATNHEVTLLLCVEPSLTQQEEGDDYHCRPEVDGVVGCLEEQFTLLLHHSLHRVELLAGHAGPEQI